MLAPFHIILCGPFAHGGQFSATFLVISLPKCAYIEKQLTFQSQPSVQGKVMHWKLQVKLHDPMTFFSRDKNVGVALFEEHSVHERSVRNTRKWKANTTFCGKLVYLYV